ncbi:MAG: LOG family protein, partial [bacterium]
PNQWVKEERRYKLLYQRLIALIDGCDAALALPGGPGTLTEIAVMWNLLLTGSIPPRLLVVIGPAWENTFNTLMKEQDAYIPDYQRKWLHFTEDINSAYNQLNGQFG